MSTEIDPTVEAAFRDLSQRVCDTIPEIQPLMDEIRGVGGSEVDVLVRLLQLCQDQPEIAQRIEDIAKDALTHLMPVPVEPEPPAPTLTDAIMAPPLVPGGLPRMNPLYEAALLERLQFDGDAPELRFGPMPEGAKPAVPVVAEGVLSPVALGWMLDAASDSVKSEQKLIETEAAKRIEADLDSTGTALDTQSPAFLARLERANLPDPVGYKRGELPAPRLVPPPSGSELVTLSREQEGQLAWMVVSTTQGRRSATGSIVSLLETKLQSDGFSVKGSRGEPLRLDKEDILAFAEWKVNLSGPNATQPGFALVNNAAMVLAVNLGRQIDAAWGDLLLEVAPINTVDVRQVGWAARLSRVAPA